MMKVDVFTVQGPLVASLLIWVKFPLKPLIGLIPDRSVRILECNRLWAVLTLLPTLLGVSTGLVLLYGAGDSVQGSGGMPWHWAECL